MLNKSIDGALLALRKQIIRGDGKGLEHVEALLAMREVECPVVLPARCATTVRKGQMRSMILDALRDGPMTRNQLVEHVAPRRPDVPPERLYWRVDAALSKVRAAELVRRERRARHLNTSPL